MTDQVLKSTVSPERHAAVKAACDGWIGKLIDPTRNNNLLYFKDLKLGTLDISNAPQETVGRLVAPACEAVPLEQLVQPGDLTTAGARAHGIRDRAQINNEERGLETLFLALGLATWPAADGGKPYNSPVFLLPIAFDQRGQDRSRLSLRRAGDLQVNLVLMYHLDSQGIQVDSAQLAKLVEGDDEGEQFDLKPAFELLTEACATLPGFKVDERFVLGNFSFQKMAMVHDLRERVSELAAHDVIAAIAQDPSARERVRGQRADIEPRQLDLQGPDQEYLVLDADSTQQRAISAVLAGQSGVISGPPGTGKSQTIANLIAECAARGRKVLFVAEKRAALDAVLKRLQERDLGHLCLDLHGADVSRRQAMRSVADGLDRVREAAKVDPSTLHRRFVEHRDKLNGHVQRMHRKRTPSALSTYDLQGRLLRLPPNAVCEARWRGSDLTPLDSERAEDVQEQLEELGGFEALFFKTHPSPWTLAVLDTRDEAQRAHDLSRVCAKSIRDFEETASKLIASGGVTPPSTWKELADRLDLLLAVNAVLARYDPEIFSQDLARLRIGLSPAAGRFKHLWALATNSTYRASRRTLLALRREAPPDAATLLDDVRNVAEVSLRWIALRVGDSQPLKADGAEQVRGAGAALAGHLQTLLSVFPGCGWDGESLELLRSNLDILAADSSTPFHVVRVRELENELRATNMGAFLDDIRQSKTSARWWTARFQYAWLRSCLDAVQLTEPEISGFKGITHQKLVEEFKRLDEQRLQVAIARVQRTHAEHVIAVRNQFPDQDAIVRNEANKKRQHLPLRELFRRAPDVVTALHPCWMASPLSVSQLVPGDRQYFDLVIFDEASQVPPEDAITSLLRGRRAVVAGDQRQLPPTTFFAGGMDEADEKDQATGGFESLLDVMSALFSPAWGLDWHYRSRDESLIAFSNHHIYFDRMVTFPGAGGTPAVRHVLVDQTTGAAGEESNSAEVGEVVRLVIEHAETRPGETLGVIAMGITHARRVELAVYKALQDRPDLADFFDSTRSDRFFVKNLERVQGDERDAIILTIGYGKDSTGRLLYRFGPLLTEGGERRLNVAVTRARSSMTVVSSFGHLDMDPSKSKARGVELLRAYLEYAANNGMRHGDRGAIQTPMNDFEQTVHDALVRRGIDVIPQWGASQYRIDLVAKHPQRPGQFVLAIECDGATYHSACTARERDRLRQQHLEALGWRFHRIWSTDWFIDPDSEIARVEKAYQEALTSKRCVERPQSQTRTSAADAPGPAPSAGIQRPFVAKRNKIDDYSEADLDSMVRWVSSSSLRTDDEIVAEVRRELGFVRRGTRIEAAIRAAIARVGGSSTATVM